MTVAQRPRLGTGQRWLFAIVCLALGVAPTVARWIPDDVTKIAYSLLLTAVLFVFTLLARKQSALQPFWELSFAFWVLSFVQVLYDLSPAFGTYILYESPTGGNPLASTVFGTVAVQLFETLVAVMPVIVLTKVAGMDLGAVYARKGKLGQWFIVSIVAFVLFYVLAATHLSNGLFPTKGSITFDHLLALTPALLVVVLSNGLQEEFLLRGLFLQKYEAFIGPRFANVLQAAIFAIWHLGITYTPGAMFFIVVFVFPLGLLFGYLMRHTDGVVTPAIFHAGADIPIFLAFLSFVS